MQGSSGGGGVGTHVNEMRLLGRAGLGSRRS